MVACIISRKDDPYHAFHVALIHDKKYKYVKVVNYRCSGSFAYETDWHSFNFYYGVNKEHEFPKLFYNFILETSRTRSIENDAYKKINATFTFTRLVDKVTIKTYSFGEVLELTCIYHNYHKEFIYVYRYIPIDLTEQELKVLQKVLVT